MHERKDQLLVAKSSETQSETNALEPNRLDEASGSSPGQAVALAHVDGRKEARARKRELRLLAAAERGTPASSDDATGEPPSPSTAVAPGEPTARPRPRRGRPRRVGDAGNGSDASANSLEPASGQGSGQASGTDLPGPDTAESQPPQLPEHMLLVPEGKRSSRVATRARRKQESAAAAVASVANAEDNPSLGALNRHLNSMMQQLTSAHRVIGRVAAERDALRQQLADLQGIPVEQIVVSTIGVSAETSSRPSEAAAEETSKPSRFAKLNYFGGDDYQRMRKRRRNLALAILGFVVVLGLSARMGFWTMPSNLSRDSLGELPYIGDFMMLFMAGWLFFRVVRVSSKGVKWVFPSEDRRRRR